MIDELPEEILIDIFSRLPAKLVGKCRCLSKRWKPLLSSPKFIKSHLNKSPQQETLILFSIHGIYSISPIHNTNRALLLEADGAVFAGSINGLVLLHRDQKDDELFLANPTTLQQVKIPDSPLALKWYESVRMHGFGYDSCTDDYKIVTLSFDYTVREHEHDRVDIFVDVYSLKMGVWRRVGNSPYNHLEPYLSSGVSVNGCVHWLARNRVLGYPYVIAAFELAHEVFDEVPGPDGVDGVDEENFECVKLTVLGGCLCMLVSKLSGELDVWIMKEYGLSDSWMKFSIDAGRARALGRIGITPLCFVGNEDDVVLCFLGNLDDGVLVIDGCRLAVYNIEKETFRDMVVGVLPMTIGGRGIATYVETLVSPIIG